MKKEKVDNRNLRVGIAGYGVVGKRRREFIDKHPHLKTTAVCDRNFKGVSSLAKGVRCFSDYRRLLEEPLDVLFVSLPNYLASRVTIAGLKRGLHVFCEKPPARDLSELTRVIKMKAKCTGQVLKYGFNHRYHDSVREALRLIRSGELGEIINMRGVYGKSKIIPFSGAWRAQRRYAGGGILLDQGIHMVDLLRLFCGEFAEVKSFISNAYWRHDVEDNAYCLLRDPKGRVAMLHSSATEWQHRFMLEIALTKGYIRLEGILSGSKSYGKEKLIVGRREKAEVDSAKEKIITYSEDNSWRDEISEFADAVLRGRQIQSGGIMDAYLTMRLVYDIYYADRKWRKAFGIRSPGDTSRLSKGKI